MASNGEQHRIRFDELELERKADSECQARVVLAWQKGEEFTGESSGIHSETGVLRCAAEAAAHALELAVGKRVMLEVLGVRTIKAFDAIIVVVALASRVSDHRQRIVGSAIIHDDAARAAVHAVLSATNRLLGDNLIYLR